MPQHWFFDAHLLDAGWSEPRCVTVCATNALRSVELEDEEMQRLATDEGLEPLRPDLETKPRSITRTCGATRRPLSPVRYRPSATA